MVQKTSCFKRLALWTGLGHECAMLLEPSLATRAAATDLIGDVLRARRPFDTAFAGHHSIAAMSTRDRAFVHNLAITTLRRLGTIDHLVEFCMKRPLPRRARQVRDILRVGSCQLLFMQVAAHGAVATCVELTRQLGHSAHIKLVNAVLRRLARDGTEIISKLDEAKVNTPEWLWETWSAVYGEDVCRQIAGAHLVGAPLDISTTGDPKTWAAELGGDVLFANTIRLTGRGQVSELPGFQDGQWWVQDAAARLVADLAGDVTSKSVIDLCAAPGGKTAQFLTRGARVTAVDRSAARLERMGKNMERLGFQPRMIQADVTKWRSNESADVVMLDAPCSATGTARRHPDVLWSKSEADVVQLAIVQQRMISAAAESVAPGGLLIFATCSLQPEEGADQVPPFLDKHPAFQFEPLTAVEIHGLAETLTPGGCFRSLPCHFPNRGGIDGFFAARFRRQNG